MGADDAIHVEIPDNSLGGPLEPLAVSKILREVIKKAGEEEEVGLVIMGKQAIDDDASQTGQMLAAQLNWPQATFASKLEFLGKLEKGEEVQVTREVDGGLAVVKTKLPFVLTTDLRLNEPRYASLPNIMKAKKKPFKKLSLKDLGLETDAKPRLETLKVAEPPKREGGAKVSRDAHAIEIRFLLCLLTQKLAFSSSHRLRMWMHWSASSRSSVVSKLLMYSVCILDAPTSIASSACPTRIKKETIRDAERTEKARQLGSVSLLDEV